MKGLFPMFRLSQMMRLVHEAPSGGGAPLRAGGSGPVVIWNLIRRCNLACKHCYSLSSDRDFSGELSFAEIIVTMEDLRAFGVPVLILSGGEPLLRPDLFTIAERAKAMGFYVGLSTNGTMIDDDKAGQIADAGFDYVGISIDGIGPVHDRFRCREGAFDAAMAGLRRCRERGVKVGLRFTLTALNADQLPGVLDLLDRENIEKFYFSHLNYAGRGNRNRRQDAFFTTTRQAMLLLFARCLDDVASGRAREWVTGNNDADGPLFLLWLRQWAPAAVEPMRHRLERWGGNASGVNVANIDNVGEVHPDTMWWHHGLGNVRQRPFSAIWQDLSDPLMAGLKQRPRPVKGRCAACRFLTICNGNTRVRAHQVSGDPWAEDPGCYLTDDEIGRAGESRLATGDAA